jgi:hypothetical protein
MPSPRARALAGVPARGRRFERGKTLAVARDGISCEEM